MPKRVSLDHHFKKGWDHKLAGKSIEERIVLIDEKIAKKQAEIAELEAKKQALLHPLTMKDVLDKAKEAGLSPKEVAAKLGLEL